MASTGEANLGRIRPLPGSGAEELRRGSAAFSSVAVGTPVKAVTLGMLAEPTSNHETIASPEANIVHENITQDIQPSWRGLLNPFPNRD